MCTRVCVASWMRLRHAHMIHRHRSSSRSRRSSRLVRGSSRSSGALVVRLGGARLIGARNHYLRPRVDTIRTRASWDPSATSIGMRPSGGHVFVLSLVRRETIARTSPWTHCTPTMLGSMASSRAWSFVASMSPCLHLAVVVDQYHHTVPSERLACNDRPPTDISFHRER